VQNDIREAAIGLGYIDARSVTGHPFTVWRNRLDQIPLGKYLSFEHDPVKATGWPLNKITIWVAVAPTPPVAEWPAGRGEIGGYYMSSGKRHKQNDAWEDAAEGLGYVVKRGVMLPERAAAIRAGLGVHGLNGLLLTPHKDYGSFVSIKLLLINAAPPDSARGPEHDTSPGCKQCGACRKACPKAAISEDGVDTTVCLRWYMNRLEDLPEGDYPKMGRRILGCDTCQNVCPFNAQIVKKEAPADMAEYMKLENLLTDPNIEKISKYIKLDAELVKMQALMAAANTGRADLLPLVEALANGGGTREKIARWAITRLRPSAC